ncbi:MAG: cellulase family glycosylhydrolase [Oscillospiraceae bacterium]|nr:cellulase family glycosylhydrolase [Oscillospiraceae bacterium]
MFFFKKVTAALTAAAMLALNGAYMVPQTITAADDCHDDWLHVEKDKIVDMNGNEVWLTGVNWFGYNVGSQVFDGVWSQNMHWCLEMIADHGFNLLRVPMSTEILLQWKNKKPDGLVKVNQYSNPELTVEGVEGGTIKYSFDIWNQAVEWCKELGIKIMIDIHCATTASNGHQWATWYDNNYGTDEWLEALEWVTDYYKDDDTLIAIDLKNEPHGKKDEGLMAKWDGSTDENNWKYAAERGAKAVLDINPNMLIMVEGIEVYPKFDEGQDWNSPSIDYVNNYSPYYGAWWGGNFRGVRDYPIDLGKYQSQLVYSPHDYGPEVWKQDWFYLDDPSKTFSRETLLEDYWYDSWAFIAEENIAPLLMGEWGGWVDEEHDKTGENRHWLKEIRDYMIDKHIHHTFWCFNENSSDTGGLVYDNFGKWDDVKYEFVKPVLWQDENGVFISLDHQYPIGKNGQSLSQYYSGSSVTTPPAVTTTAPAATTPAPTTTTAIVFPVTSATTKTETSVSTEKKTPGDVNCDGDIGVDDVVLLARMLAEDTDAKITEQGQINADVDGKTGLSSGDVAKILRVIARMDQF